VSETAVSPEIRVANAEVEADHINVGKYGACCADDPNAFGDVWAIEARAYPEGGYRVREG
jgi:hypothetical protein